MGRESHARQQSAEAPRCGGLCRVKPPKNLVPEKLPSEGNFGSICGGNCPLALGMSNFTPPPKLPEEVEDLFAACDYTELEYRNIEHMRRHLNPTDEMRAKIAAHDELESRIVASPNEVMREAHQALDHGMDLLLKLIRSKKLRGALHPTELGKANGVESEYWDESFNCLSSRIDYINRQLIRLAEIGVPGARRSVFFEAQVLSESFIRLAQAHPKDFKQVAETSLTMPSVRARDPSFTADAQKIAQNIHLAEKHPAGRISDNRERLGSLCHRLVASLVNDVQHEREQYLRNHETYFRMRDFSETAEEYSRISFNDYLKSLYYPTRLPGILISGELPELRDAPDQWWTSRILPLVKEAFAQLQKQPMRNPALWDELKVKTTKDTPAAMRRLLEKNCRNKFLRIAQNCP